jgi:NTE family protein
MEHRIGIVLSGGGSRGLAHAGVLAALTEHGIEPTCIAGTSAGAIVGALYAAGYDAAATIEFFELASPFRLSRVALRKPGFLDTEAVIGDFRKFFPDDSFEALRKRLFVTATDLERGRLQVFSSGPLIRPVIASSAIPLIFTPVPIDGHLYVDGGVLDNFPIEPLLGLCDATLGVYVSPLDEQPRSSFSTSFAVAQRAFDLGMHAAARRTFHRADYVLIPEALRGRSRFDAKHHKEYVEIGYEAAVERIPQIREAIDRAL